MTIQGEAGKTGGELHAREPRRASDAVLRDAALALATPTRSAEAILRAPTAREWRAILRRLDECAPCALGLGDDDGAFDEERVNWTLLHSLCETTFEYWRIER
jgi:hypothetical protein